MRAAIYCRVSTTKQKEEGTSLETQKPACLALGAKNNYEVPENLIFLEDWSGARLDRPQLDMVRDLIRRREINALIAYSTDRLSRDPIHIGIIAEECQKKGVALLFVTEPLDTSPEGQLILYVKGYAGKIERAKFADRSLRGKKTRAKLGKIPGAAGTNLYGYNYIPGKEVGQGIRVINEEQAEIVRMIYRWLIEDKMTLYRICIKLTESGIHSPQGTNRWGTSTVHRLLRNIAYTGRTYVFRYQSQEPNEGNDDSRRYPKTLRRERPFEEWVEVIGATPPIISEETFELAQIQLRENQEKSFSSQKYHYLLLGHIRCGLCGRRYDAYTNGAGYQHYRCSGKRREVSIIPCSSKSISALQIEPKVWKKVKEVLQDPGVVLRELERQNEQIKASEASLDNELKILDKRIARTESSLQQLVRLYHLGEIDDNHIIRETRKVKADKARLIQEKEALKKRLEVRNTTEYQIGALKRYCETVSKNIESFGFAEKRLALEALNVTVIAGQEEIKLHGTIPTEVSRVSQPSSRQEGRSEYQLLPQPLEHQDRLPQQFSPLPAYFIGRLLPQTAVILYQV
jgi:site-specific DNA recombinase